jgi:5'-nucleotidase
MMRWMSSSAAIPTRLITASSITKIVTSALSFGRLVTDIDLEIDLKTGDVSSMTAGNVIVTRTVPKHPLLTALVDKYRALVAPLANRVIGSITADITRRDTRGRISPG